MNATKLFPFALIALDVGAALVYAWHCDIRHAIYWLAAATLTATVTFSKGGMEPKAKARNIATGPAAPGQGSGT